MFAIDKIFCCGKIEERWKCLSFQIQTLQHDYENCCSDYKLVEESDPIVAKESRLESIKKAIYSIAEKNFLKDFEDEKEYAQLSVLNKK